MSDNIDYDELDKAVSEAIKSRATTTRGAAKPAAKAPVKPKTSSGPVPIPAVQPTAAPKPIAQRPKFMDFARPARSAHRATKPTSITVTSAPKVAPTRPVTQKPAARHMAQQSVSQRPATQKLVATAPSSHAVQPMKSAPAHTVSPQIAAELRQQQLLARKRQLIERKRRELLLKQQQAARKASPQIATAPKLAQNSAQNPNTVAEAAARAKATIEAQNKAEAEAPNANNYSVGVRSPFLTDAKIEKRPLGTNIPETSVNNLTSTKNVYSQKSPIKKKTTKKHTVVQAEHKTSGWVWTLIVLFVIAAGGALGYLAYLLVFTNQF